MKSYISCLLAYVVISSGKCNMIALHYEQVRHSARCPGWLFPSEGIVPVGPSK